VGEGGVTEPTRRYTREDMRGMCAIVDELTTEAFVTGYSTCARHIADGDLKADDDVDGMARGAAAEYRLKHPRMMELLFAEEDRDAA
jgi:hypothetical protein